MRTIESKTKNSNSWKEAKIRLDKFNQMIENFDKMVELIKKYPIKLTRRPLPSPPYELDEYLS